jgi:hypothetical protein
VTGYLAIYILHLHVDKNVALPLPEQTCMGKDGIISEQNQVHCSDMDLTHTSPILIGTMFFSLG